MTPTDEHELLTVPEAAMELRLSAPSIRRLVREGLLPAVQVAPGHALRIRRADLDRVTTARPRSAA